jgi:hypothetical protein
MGRKSTFNEKDAAEIVARLSKGETLADVARDLNIGRTTVYDWQVERPEFAERIARARTFGFDAIAERTRATARGIGPEYGGDGTGDVQRDKLIIETDLKLLAKWDPKRFGDKLAHVGGADGDAPIKSELTVRFV